MRNPSSSSSPTAKAGGGSGSATVTAGKSTTTTPCCSKVGLKRGPWTPEEDELLANYIKKEGEGRWRTLPKRAGLLRCGKSCRLRWMNYLRPSVKRGQIAPDEEDLILRLHRLLGNRWSLIAGRIPGRTDNEIKNYWNTHLSKKLISQGIDPRTHKPLNPDSSGAANANKASSSKTNRNIPNPNPNIPASPVVTEELTPDSDSGIIPIKENIGYFQSSNLDDHQLLHGYTALPNSDGNSGMGLRGNYNNGPSSTEEEDDMNYCSDDVFSSFLNSLINDDAFAAQHHQLQQHPSTGIAPVSSDPLISIATSSFGGLGAGWELFAADDQVVQYSTTSFIEITGNQTPLVHKLYVVNHLGDTMVKRIWDGIGAESENPKLQTSLKVQFRLRAYGWAFSGPHPPTTVRGKLLCLSPHHPQRAWAQSRPYFNNTSTRPQLQNS